MAITKLAITARSTSSSPTGGFDSVVAQGLRKANVRFGYLYPRTRIVGVESAGRLETACSGKAANPIQVAVCRRRGALILLDVPPEPTPEPVADVHRRAVATQRRLRRRLDDRPLWRQQPIVLGIGLIVAEGEISPALPPCVPRQLIVPRDTADSVADRIADLFAYFTTPATEPVADYAPRLLEDVTESPGWIGRYVDDARSPATVQRRPETSE